MRKAGVLLPVSALMSEFGIGDFGRSARFFVDFIKQMGFKIWQVLPISIIGSGNSPYSGVSAFAGNPMFIDVTNLTMGSLTAEEIDDCKINAPYKVDYFGVRTKKLVALKSAYQRIGDSDIATLEKFEKEHDYWLPDYALYMTMRDAFDCEWGEWENKYRLRNKRALNAFKKEHSKEYYFYIYEQYLFYTQWELLKTYANDNGIEIFGDMPIYVAYNSPDVWAHSEQFLLNKEDLKPTFVAGVPPDYFAENGQLWGNPLYDYKTMEKDNYAWFISRIKHNLKLYDILRIDHFRGLCEYWAVPATAETAKEGKWEKGPNIALFEYLKKEVDEPNIVAEDLGIIDEKVEKFLADTGFPGMRVIQFAFDGNKANPHLPYNYDKNTVAYTATHDNNTTLGWLYSLDYYARENVLRFINLQDSDWGAGGRYCKSTRALAREIIASSANTVILPLQDLCGYGGDTRINVPGVAEGNWEYRATLSALEDVDTDFYRGLLELYGR